MRSLMGALLMLALAQSAVAADSAEDKIRAAIAQLDQRVNITSVEPAALEGLYEVLLSSGEVLYASEQGDYFLAGELYHIDPQAGFVNLTEQRLSKARAEALAQVKAEDRVIFAPKGEVKARIQVFTDVDCVYCRRLHNEVAELNALGIQVDYLAFPRGGAQSPAAATMETIWCAKGDERKALFTRAKQGEALDPVRCDSPVMAQFELGQKLGVTGTPAIVLEDGRLVPGYVPAQRMAQMLGL